MNSHKNEEIEKPSQDRDTGSGGERSIYQAAAKLLNPRFDGSSHSHLALFKESVPLL